MSIPSPSRLLPAPLLQARPLAALVLALVLGGCSTGPYTPPPVHRVEVVQKPAYLVVALPRADSRGEARFADSERSRLAAFLDIYRNRGRGPLTVTVVGAKPRQAEQAIAALTTVANRRGVSQNSLAPKLEPSGPPRMVLGFTDHDVKIPPCPYEIMGKDNFNNEVSPSLGCAVDNSIAAMIASPADLLGPRALAPGDAQRSDRVISSYRQGEATPAEEPASGAAPTIFGIGQ